MLVYQMDLGFKYLKYIHVAEHQPPHCFLQKDDYVLILGAAGKVVLCTFVCC